MEQFLRVGVITSTHGIRGDVKVFCTSDDPARFKKLKTCYIDTKKTLLEMQVTSCKLVKGMPVIHFEGYDTIESMEPFKGKDILVDRAHAVKCQKNEFFIVDLVGLAVETDEGEALGTLTDVLQTGANDVFVVTEPDGNEILVPYIEQCVPEIHPETGKVIVHLLPGLRELNQ